MGDADASRDMLGVRRQQVRAAVAALRDALGGAGQTYLKHVKKWADELEPTAPKLAAFTHALHVADKKLRDSAPHLCPARDAFVQAVALARKLFTQRAERPAAPRVSVAQTLSDQVREIAPRRPRPSQTPFPPPSAPAPAPCTIVSASRHPMLSRFFSQCFDSPVPAGAGSAPRLLENLRVWARAEGDRVRHARLPDAQTAKAYATALELWARKIHAGDEGRAPTIPKVAEVRGPTAGT